MDTSEAGMGSSGSSDNTAQPSTHSQAPQQVQNGIINRFFYLITLLKCSSSVSPHGVQAIGLADELTRNLKYRLICCRL